MGQCISHCCIAAQATSDVVSPKPVPETVKKKKKRGGLFRWAFSRKSGKTTLDAQQSQCRSDSSQTSLDGEADQSINTPNPEENTDSSSAHNHASSLADVQEVEVPEQEQEEEDKSAVSSMNEENIDTPLTPDGFIWKIDDEIVHLSSMAKTEDIKQHYDIGKILGHGGYGSVWEGTRLSDSRKVALKYVLRNRCYQTTQPGQYGKPLPTEVAMMIRLSNGPYCPQIIKLLDWYETPNHYILVIERPTPCQDLRQFLVQRDCRISEFKARVVMHQAVTAARICCERRVFHSDIKLENLLINENTLQVKLIDFGVSKPLRETAYSRFIGTKVYAPPEAFLKNSTYHAKPATVYSLGVLLFVMLTGKFPSKMKPKVFAKTLKKANISKECTELISSCIEKDPAKRIELEKILLHNWFQALILNPESS